MVLILGILVLSLIFAIMCYHINGVLPDRVYRSDRNMVSIILLKAFTFYGMFLFAGIFVIDFFVMLFNL